MKKKVAVIGLDGATWKVILPLVEQGKLPNIKNLLEAGASGVLQSTFPPLTGPAWTSIATGKNPGKTGIYDFFNRISRNSYELGSLTSASMREVGTFWDYLSAAGIKVGILNYPFLYPPYPVNGFMVSGLGASIKNEITYPKELKEELFSACQGYKIEVPFNMPPYINKPSLFVEDCLKLLEINAKALKFLVKKYDPEMLFGVISATDFAQHYMWKFIDKTHPLYNEKEAKHFAPLFIEIWERADQILGDILSILGNNGNLIVISDHGCGPAKGAFYLRCWLEKEGYLPKTSNWLQRNLYLTTLLLLDKVAGLNPYLHGLFLKIGARGKPLVIGEPDSPQGIAFIGERSAGQGEIFINSLRVKDKQEFLRIKQEIIERLTDTCANLNLKIDFYAANKLYSGRNTELAPDILFAIDDFEVVVQYGLSNAVYKKGPPKPYHSGDHNFDGVFLAYGPDIKRGIEIDGAKVYDIAPTVLHMFGLPVPKDMDGRVLKEIFREDSEIAMRPIKYQEVGEETRVRRRIDELKRSGKI